MPSATGGVLLFLSFPSDFFLDMLSNFLQVYSIYDINDLISTGFVDDDIRTDALETK